MLARLLILSLLLPLPAQAQCEVRGVATLDRIRVRRPASQPIRTFAVNEVPIAVRPGRNGHYRDVRVLGPLAFEGRSDATIPWTIGTARAVAGGAVWLTPMAEIEEVVEDARGALVVRVQVAEDVWISRLHLPCDELTIGRGEGSIGDPRGYHVPPGPRWQPQSDRMWIMSGLGEGAAVRVDAPRGLPSPLVETERRGAWMHVVTAFSSGTVLRGWVRRTELRMARAGREEPRAFVRTLAPPASSSCAAGPRLPGEELREATVVAGTNVSTGPRGTVWAVFPADTPVTIATAGGSGWVRVVRVRGIFGDGRCRDVLNRAWIPPGAVTLR